MSKLNRLKLLEERVALNTESITKLYARLGQVLDLLAGVPIAKLPGDKMSEEE